MTPDELKDRTKRFAVDTIRFARTLPRDEASRVMAKQLVRCATSVGANYRAACLAKSNPDMVSKLKIVEEESDESQYWLEILVDTETVEHETTSRLHKEANEIFKIMSASIKTLRKNQLSIVNRQSSIPTD
ncbi:MAG TPA: four helix bundle protein [Fimbriimonadaceae bacterium]|nr:four helix bundle protein [Fimbriimonadaceae bacterium]